MIRQALPLLLADKSRHVVWYQLLFQLMRPFDRVRAPKGLRTENSTPPLFIVGLPRSGSTLLYQYLSQVANVAYTSNKWSVWPKSGATSKRILTLTPPATTTNFFGNGKGSCGVQEGGTILQQWIDESARVHQLSELSPEATAAMRSYFDTATATAGKPIMMKNARFCVRTKMLHSVFPAARFIVIRRDLHDIAQSMYRGRVALTGDPSVNFTTVPAEWSSIENLSPAAQVAWQTAYLAQRMEADLRLIPGEQIVQVTYESFSKNPYQTALDILASFELDERAGLTSGVKAAIFHRDTEHTNGVEDWETELKAALSAALSSTGIDLGDMG